jgi:hypothetical protein
MPNPTLDIFDDLPGRALVPAPIEMLSREPQLDKQIPGVVLWRQFAPLFSP